MAASFKVTDNSEIFLGALAAQLEDAAHELENTIIENVEWKMMYGYHEPHGKDGHTEIYDTGRLLQSIESEVKTDYLNFNGAAGFVIEVSANTEYAMFVHQGTRKLHGRPFLVDGMKKAMPEFESTIKRHLKN